MPRPPTPPSALPPGWTARTLPAVRRKLLAWFDRHRRDLPWRRDRDPYRIWVSEVMLQQTTVAAAGPYFERFVAAFPDVQALADADEQAVLTLWQGLGYYRRARHLHAAAKRIVGDHGGAFPRDPAAVAALPGVGRYILGAVLSQAFDARLPVVEANTLRVLSRLFGSRLDPRAGEGNKWVWAAAEAVLPKKRTGDFNQAMMELGAVVCKPDAPRCPQCPVRAECVANREGLQAVIPPKPKAKELVAVREVGVVIRDGNTVLLARRPPTADRWANMWEVPRGEVRAGETDDAAAVRIASGVGFTVEVGREIAVIRHGVTRFAITLVGLEAAVKRGKPKSDFYPEFAWVPPAGFAEFPMSTSQARLLAAATDAARRLF